MDIAGFKREIINLSLCRNGSRWIYRGQASNAWPLKTHYSRFLSQTDCVKHKSFSLDPFLEMLNRFLLEASELQGKNFMNYSFVQQMAIAQHHGLPTPILDWTYSPYIALYFAVNDPIHTDENIEFCVHAINVDKNKQYLMSKNAFENMSAREDICNTPLIFLDTNRFFSRRIARQQGCFTFQNFFEGLDEVDSFSELDTRKFEIVGNRKQILAELRLMGLSTGMLFDDLDSISSDIKRDWEISL